MDLRPRRRARSYELVLNARSREPLVNVLCSYNSPQLTSNHACYVPEQAAGTSTHLAAVARDKRLCDKAVSRPPRDLHNEESELMKTLTSLLAPILLAIVLSSPALAQDVDAAKTCKPGSTKGNCLLALITTLQGQVATLQTALAAVQNNHALALAPFVSVDASAENGVKGPNIVISGANVHIESGSGTTADSTGLGNLVIGYDEDSLAASTIDPNRTGSHNLVVGPDHQFTASGGAVFGFGNFISSNAASITGGDCNAAGATAFPAGLSNCFEANPGIDSVSGGELNTSNGSGSSVNGGQSNTSSSQDSSVSGGAFNTSSGAGSSVSGGKQNTASKDDASVSGGLLNTASGQEASVSGGESNTASGDHSSILGGNSVTVSTTDGHSP
jgi:hypothetical protein